MTPRERVILAVDVGDADSAVRMVELLRDAVGAFKVGSELVNAAGTGIFEKIRHAGAERIFYDAKFHDIPNTAAGAARAAAKHDLWMIIVHAAGGSRKISAAAGALKEYAHESGVNPPILLGVTLLTSISSEELACELHVSASPADYVRAMARMVMDSGGQGVVASAHEIEAVRDECGAGFAVVTPGVRPSGVEAGDQRRTLTPGEAVRRGADYLVIGRPITAADNPRAAAMRILDEIA
jgi:orotidine-5'-phosphate decarboxylase